MARVTGKSQSHAYAPGRTPTPAEPAAPAAGAVTKPAPVSAKDVHVSAPKSGNGPVAAPAAQHVVVPPTGNVLGSVPANLTALEGQRGFVRVEQPTRAQLEGAVAMSFEQGKGQPSVALKAGGRFLLSYDPRRTPYTGSANGVPAYGVTAYVQLQPSGKIIEKPAIAFEQTSARVLGQPYAAPVLIELPAGTTGVSVWFKQFSYGDRPPAEGWDSNYGQNYNFAVR